jgi:predicted nucleic acid-binding protein
MAMTTGRTFLDTNVLLRATIEGFPLHKEAKQLVYLQREADNELWISRQVIREYVAQVTRPQVMLQPLAITDVVKRVETFGKLFLIADETADVTAQLLALMKEFPTGGKQVHDANIVATMLAYGIDTLLTQNVEDMKRFAAKIKLVPLGEVKS